VGREAVAVKPLFQPAAAEKGRKFYERDGQRHADEDRFAQLELQDEHDETGSAKKRKAS